MCGRIVLTAPGAALKTLFDLVDEPMVVPRFNIAPTQPLGIVRITADRPDTRAFELVHWGLVPNWAKDVSSASKMINARSESVTTKAGYRGALKYRRCLIPATGFYEWKTTHGQKQPWFIHLHDQPFAMAGLWEHWQDPHGNELESATVITTAANAFMSALHDRMPVIMPEAGWDRWLDPNLQDPDDVIDLLQPCASEVMAAYPVTRRVGNPQFDRPECLIPIEEQGFLFT